MAQIRVRSATHQKLKRLSKKSGAPVTEIVDRLVKRETNETNARDAAAGEPTTDPKSSVN